MAMTPIQMVGFFREQAQLFIGAIPEAIASGHHPSLNYSEGVKAYMMEGLISWRHGLGNPRDAFSRALDVCRDAVRTLGSTSKARPVWQEFDPTPGVFLACLLEDRPDMALLGHACQLSDWKELSMYNVGQALDVGLLRALESGSPVPEWGTAITAIQAKKRWRLLAETFSNYMSIIVAARAGEREVAKEAAIAAGALYRRRARSGVYGPAQTEGGGPDNDHVVDYRLAAIIQTVMPGIAQELRSQNFPHVWHWRSQVLHSPAPSTAT